VDDEDLELRVGFSEADRLTYIRDLAYLAQGYHEHLSGAPQGAAQDLSKKIIQLKDETANFGPTPEVIRLDEAAFAARNLAPGATVKALLQQDDFYAITFAVTLFPKVDWQFDRLECQIELNSGGSAPLPVAFDVYPYDEWNTIVQLNMKLDVGVDEQFKFDAQLPPGTPGLSGQVRARVNAGLGIVVPPRDYSLRRATVVSRGRGNSQVFWRLLGTGYFEQTEPRLGLVVRVPKGVPSVRADGVLAAYRTANFWTAALGSLFQDLPDRIRSWLGRGSPLYGQASWTLVPAG
jgi:hypothetical protein